MWLTAITHDTCTAARERKIDNPQEVEAAEQCSQWSTMQQNCNQNNKKKKIMECPQSWLLLCDAAKMNSIFTIEHYMTSYTYSGGGMLSGLTSFNQLLCRAEEADIRLLGSSSSMRSSRSKARIGKLRKQNNITINHVTYLHCGGVYIRISHMASCTL